VIRVEQHNDVSSLKVKLQSLRLSDKHDSGFPIVREDDGGLRLVGYIGVNELEHALSRLDTHLYLIFLH
jgi:chloride channel 3/4/5